MNECIIWTLIIGMVFLMLMCLKSGSDEDDMMGCDNVD